MSRQAFAAALLAWRQLRLFLHQLLKLHRDEQALDFFFESRRLARLPVGIETTTRILGHAFVAVDPPGFLQCYHEIFEQEIYHFSPRGLQPRVIDCGANTGLATIWFKSRFPGAVVTAVEADPRLCTLLRQNLLTFGLRDVAVLEAAAWTSTGRSSFTAQGGFSGHLGRDASDPSLPVVTVETIRLYEMLVEHTDLLKLDIEGSEIPVLADCCDRLANVENLIVEYHGSCGESSELHSLLSLLASAGLTYAVDPVPLLYGDADERTRVHEMTSQFLVRAKRVRART